MKLTSKIYTFIIFALLYLPIIVVLIFSFNSNKSFSVFGGFSLRWYGELLKNDEAINALINSVILALSSSLAATVIGTAAAIGIYKMKNKRAKKLIMSVTNIPMMNPDIVTGVSMLLLFALVFKLLNIQLLGFWALLIAHITFNLPYVILSIMPKLKQMDKNLPEAAMDLGCSPFKAFYKVILFEILPGIASGFFMAFTLSIDDFVISYFAVGSSKFQTLPIYIYTKARGRVKPDLAALFALIFIAVLVLLIIKNVLSTDNRKAKDKD